MSFLAPLFLIGAAAVAAPVLFHLIRRTTRDRRPFSSVMFLEPSPPRLSRRHRLEHLLLLVLRCVVLVLLALAFARPFLVRAPAADAAAGPVVRSVVLLDVSASMRREGMWPQARAAVLTRVQRAGPADRLVIIAFDRGVTTVLSFEDWQRTPASERVALVTARLGTVAPGWESTHLGNALIAAADALAESDATAPNAEREVVLVSDVQEGSRLDGLQGYDWPKGIRLVVSALAERSPTNAGLSFVGEGAAASQADARGARVRVTNATHSRREQFAIGWAGAGDSLDGRIDAYVPAGQSRVFTVRAAASAATQPSERIVLRGDDEVFDNTLHVVPPLQQMARVLWLGAPDANPRAPLVFLRRAYTDTPRVAVRLEAPALSAVSDAAIGAADLVFVASDLSAGTAAAVRRAIADGRTAVVLTPERGGALLGALLGGAAPRVDSVEPQNYAMFGEIDFRHPLFAPFADPRFSDFTKIHVWRYRRIDLSGIPAVHVLARFDTGDVALAEVPVGKGRVFVFATGWQPEESQLAVSSKFVPLVWSLLDLTGATVPASRQISVGDAIPVPRGATAVQRPGGAVAALAAGQLTFADTGEPGVYAFVGAERPSRFAVNVDPNESRTAPLALDELERLGVPVKTDQADAAAAATRATVRAAEAENRQKLWRWLIVTALVVVLVESALAGWTARQASPATEEGVS